MGKGRLQRIAALTALGTASVMVAGAMEVAALVGVSTPEITTTVPTTTTQVTVPSTTTTVPSTPVTPTTTVTTPKVTTPTVTTPKVTAPKVTTPKVTTPDASPTRESGSGGGGGSTVTQQTSSALDTVGGVVEGGTSGATSGTKETLGGAGGTLGGAGGGISSGSGTGAGSGSGSALALGFFDGGGPGGAAGRGGNGIFGAGASGGPGGGGLPPALSAARARQLRSVLDQLEGCMTAIAPVDRRVLSMRAGGSGAAPLSRSQVAGRLGMSTREVRRSERRGLSGLRAAAEQTGCAGAVAGGPFALTGIGAMTLATLLAPPDAGTAVLARSGGSDYVPARQAGPGVESPLAGLAGGGDSGPAWLVVLFTVLFSVSIAALMRELRSSVGA